MPLYAQILPNFFNALISLLCFRLRFRAVNSAKRLKFAVAEKAEGQKILQVKAAEAEAEAKYLSGVGVAKQRKAIVDGLRSSIVVSGSVACVRVCVCACDSAARRERLVVTGVTCNLFVRETTSILPSCCYPMD